MANNTEILEKSKLPKPRKKDLPRFDGNQADILREQGFERDFNSAKRIGHIIVFIVFGVFGLWASFMPIDSATHGMGQLTVKSFKKPVQHLEGGIVKEVRVHDGDLVKTGDVLIVMDDTQPRAQLDSMITQLKARLAIEARLIAERDNLPAVVYPPELSPDNAEALQEINAQNQIFKARKANLNGETSVLQQQTEQLQSRIKGLESMRESKALLATSYQEEAKDFQALLAEGFADKLRLHELERNHAMMSADAADLTATIASTKIQIGEAKLQIIQLQNKYQSDIASTLSEVQTQLKELRDRITAVADAVRRAEVLSPDNGIIYNLRVHTPDTVIPAGIVLAEIVPQNDQLIIEFKVSPIDIDNVAVGQNAKVILSSFSSRRRALPTLYGKVIGFSADALTDPTNGAAFYMAKLELSPESLDELKELTLVPGMPAEVFVNTGSRTFFQYVFRPLTDGMSRSFKEP